MKNRLFALYLILNIVFAGHVAFADADAEADPESKPPKVKTTQKRSQKSEANPALNLRVEEARQDYLNSLMGGMTRIKDIADVQGVRGNQLIGYGLVIGLEGTGDGQSSAFTPQTVANMLRKFAITLSVPSSQLQVKNVAAVMVTSVLPPFLKSGSLINVTVSSIGDAKSLQGGTLLQTPLRAADGGIYAVAQGAVSIGGFNFGAGGSSIQKNHVTAGRIPQGATVEQDVPTTLSEAGIVRILLRDPDFTTASRTASAIRSSLPGVFAEATDPGTISIQVPPEQSGDLISFISRIERVGVTPDIQARIIVNERTGTVVMGGNVRLSKGAIAHGAISIKIENNPIVVPGASFSNQPTVVVPQQTTTVQEKASQLASIPATTTVDQLVRALNTLGVTPRDLISILQGMQSAGMISATIEVQ